MNTQKQQKHWCGKFTKHVKVTDSMLARLRFGEFRAQAHDAVNDHRDHKQAHLNLPSHLAHQEIGGETASNQSTRPASVEDVQVVRLVFGEERRHERIYDCFRSSVSNGEHEHSPKQAFVK